MRFFRCLLCVLACPVLFAANTTGLHAPVTKFRLPSFNDQGFRSTMLEGTEAKIISTSQIDMKDMQFTLFTGDENSTVDTTLVAPTATVRILEKNQISVEGGNSVRLVRDDLDAYGENWSYRHAEKRLIMRKNVRVVIHAQLNDILK